MTQQQKARYLTILVIGCVVAMIVGQKIGLRRPLEPPEPSRAPEPRDAIYKMLDAARAGDAGSYFSCFTGQMAATLRQSQIEMGEAGFSRYLTDTNKQIKGVALTEPVPLTDREARVRVEYVYQDRNEAQQVYLEKTPEGWRIARVDSTERVKTLVPYGTPVN